jgi:membrane protein DedA with SNARE-associated domain
MSGGVAIHLTQLARSRVQSLALISAIGAQEMELFGDYHLNHAVHGVQLGFFWLLQEGFPHFGYLDDAYLNVAYARNFFDTNQRPLRELLQRYDGPMLIVHGNADPLVPLAAAREHHRLVPHSELQIFAGGHELVFAQAEMLAPALASFIRKSARGEARTLADADPERMARARAPFDPGTIPKPQGIAWAALMLLLAFATLVSEDLTCISAGLLVARGTMSFWSASSACLIGIYCGDLLLYALGKILGSSMLARAPLRWFITSGDVNRAKTWFEVKGVKVVFLSRFLPGSRLPTYVASGLLGVNFWKFSFYLLGAAAIWTPLVVLFSSGLGQPVKDYLSLYGRYALPVFVASALVIWILLRLTTPLFSFRSRRLLLSWWRRKTRWEFWPLWWFYPPVFVYCLYLALKHRSLTLFTAANPGIWAGGFIGESKFDILQKLCENNGTVACFGLIPPSSFEERHGQVREFMRRRNLSFPVVLKPDVGQRGAGVAIIQTPEELEDYLRQEPASIIVQEYVPGHEFGVFYYRYPDQESGDIYAITDKRFPTVVGDGSSMLEELILRDDRAVCMAPFYLDKHRTRLHEIPAPGERIQLVEVGTHCRGAMFLDGTALKTPALVEAVDRVTRNFHGFYFGRYDIRVAAVEDFKQGRNFKVVELNGVTSEATSIYDPGNSLWQAYRVLFKQWRMAFEIAAQNVAAGAKPVPLKELLYSLWTYKTTNAKA